MSGVPTYILNNSDERYDKITNQKEFKNSMQIVDSLIAASTNTDAIKKNATKAVDSVIDNYKMFLYATYKPYVNVAYEYIKIVQAGGSHKFSASNKISRHFNMGTCSGHFISDMVFHVKIGAIGSTTATTTQYRYCAFPGLRLIKKATMGSDLQHNFYEYDSDYAVRYMKHRVPAEHLNAYMRSVGQQDVKHCTFEANTGYTGYSTYSNGPQTWKSYQPELEMWIPSCFYSQDDPAKAIFNFASTNKQFTVTTDIAPFTWLVSKRTLVVDPVAGDHWSYSDITAAQFTMSMEIYVNNIWTDKDLYAVLVESNPITLVRTVNTNSIVTVSNPTDDIKLDNLKFAGEYLYVGFRSKDNADDYDLWHLMGMDKSPTDPEDQFGVLTTRYIGGMWTPINTIPSPSPFSGLSPMVDRVTITVKAGNLYNDLAIAFYGTYLPMRYFNQTDIHASEDASSLVIPFSLLPGKKEPSGYYPLSSNVDLVLKYSSSDIDASTQAELLIQMISLNFLVIDKNSIQLLFHV